MDIFYEKFGLAGKTAVVTGATRGIGAAMAIALAEAGADVISVQVDHPCSLIPPLSFYPGLTLSPGSEITAISTLCLKSAS